MAGEVRPSAWVSPAGTIWPNETRDHNAPLYTLAAVADMLEREGARYAIASPKHRAFHECARWLRSQVEAAGVPPDETDGPSGEAQ